MESDLTWIVKYQRKFSEDATKRGDLRNKKTRDMMKQCKNLNLWNARHVAGKKELPKIWLP